MATSSVCFIMLTVLLLFLIFIVFKSKERFDSTTVDDRVALVIRGHVRTGFDDNKLLDFIGFLLEKGIKLDMRN